MTACELVSANRGLSSIALPTWPNGADLDPEWVHDEVSGNKTWFVPI